MKNTVRVALLFIIFVVYSGWGGIPTHASMFAANSSVSEFYNNNNGTEESTETELPVEEQEVDSGVNAFDYIRMIAALGFVVFLLYVLLKFVNLKTKPNDLTKTIITLGGTPLGGNRSVQLIKVGERILVVGVGEDITLLKEIENKEEYNKLIEGFEQSYTQKIEASSFVNTIKQRINPSASKEELNFSHEFKQKLAEMKKDRSKLFDELNKQEQNKDD
ncbi:flagellar biosynthetic protein FliO [Bacillus coahuilensis]|uniref:flagellar biosynthetic protein FliO n=1 Tax=Bacillus coahuilensis TaxID=408580 RepID=UPI00075021E2|nr:flagellar biosynthetic protein FliO [Bacillus coahuilensis]